MNTRELAKVIAERSYNLTQDQVGDVLALFAEIVAEELARPDGYIYLGGIGRLHIDYHELRPGGVLNGHYWPGWTLRRLYFRWVPTDTLKEDIRQALIRAENAS